MVLHFPLFAAFFLRDKYTLRETAVKKNGQSVRR